MDTVAGIITDTLLRLLGANDPVRVVPRVDERAWDVCIGDGGPDSFVHTYREGDSFTAEVAQEWVNEYRLLRIYGGPRVVAFTPAPVPWEAVPTTVTNATFVAGTTIRYPIITEAETGGIGTMATLTNPAPINPNMRTREQEARLLELNRMYTTVNMTPLQIEERDALRRLSAHVEMRTVEQETRFQELEIRGQDEMLPEAEATEYGRLRAMGRCATPIPARIRVRVHRSQGGDWEVIVRVGAASRELPSVSVIRALLPPSEKHFLAGRQSRYRNTIRYLRDALSAGLSAQSLHDALRAWVTASVGQVTNASSIIPASGIDEATVNLLRAQPATLEVGGLVYRLVPCHQVDVRPLITRVRERALTHARTEAGSIRERATADARVMTTEAERSAQRIRTEAEASLRMAGARVPDWVRASRRPHYFDNEKWHVELRVSCMIRDIRLTVAGWATILHWLPINSKGLDYYRAYKMPLWFRLGQNGEYDMHSIHAHEGLTPHISSYACMSLQALPSRVDSVESLRNLELAVERGVSVINLNSPLSQAISNFWPDFREQIPPTVVKWFRGDYRIEPPVSRVSGRATISIAQWREQHPDINWDSAETIRQEEEGTFTVDTPPVPLAAPPVTVDETLAYTRQQLQNAQVATARVTREGE